MNPLRRRIWMTAGSEYRRNEFRIHVNRDGTTCAGDTLPLLQQLTLTTHRSSIRTHHRVSCVEGEGQLVARTLAQRVLSMYFQCSL